MGCQEEVALGSDFTFTITTHDPTTAALTDADAAPTYRIYEEETAVPILNGTMAILDNAGTTGFYSEEIAATAANGFEVGLSYNIYIEATVGGTTGGISYAFRVIRDPTLAAGAGEFTYTVTSTATGLPLEGAEVWISTDAAGANVIWHGDTDVFGVARDDADNLPMLDDGTYYFWTQLGGYTFVNPDVEVVG